MPAVVAAQTVVLPTTITTVAGGSPLATTAGSACPTNPLFIAQDATGNGCPAYNATVPTTVTSLTTDPAGNVYFTNNTTSSQQYIRRIDARTGNITQIAGYALNGGNQCTGGGGTTIYGTKAASTDKFGDGCPVGYSYQFNGAVALGGDPYGNILLGTTGDNVINLICNASSPACSALQAGKNLMIGAAGCTTSPTGSGTAKAGTTPGSAGDGSLALQTASCTAGLGGRVYAVTADKWDNIYFTDATNNRIRVVAGPASVTLNGTVYSNPLYATLATFTLDGGTTYPYSTPVQGYIYPVVGGGTVCSGKSDAYGDGCPFWQTTVNAGSSGAYLTGLTIDPEGNLIFDDAYGNLRIVFENANSTIVTGALKANGIASPQVGYSYVLVGGGSALNYNSGAPTGGMVLGKNAALQASAIQTLTSDPAGNVVIGDQMQVLFYDLRTGYLRRLGTASGVTTTCNASTLGDGCPLGQSKFNAFNTALSVSEDALGNLYLLDITNQRVRRVSGSTLPTTAVNTAAPTTFTVHAPAATQVQIASTASSDISGVSATCTTTNTDGSIDCSVPVAFTPVQLAQRNLPVSVVTTNGTASTQSLALTAQSTGAALVFDTATPATSTIAATLTGVTSVYADGSGALYTSGTGGINRVSAAGAIVNVASSVPNYMAVDAAGNVYTTAGSTTNITKYTFYAAASTYSSSTIAVPKIDICTSTTTSISCALTQATTGPLVVDPAGIIYMVDLTNKEVVKFSPSATLGIQLNQVALTSPTAMSQDAFGNLLIIDGSSVLRVPSTGIATTTASPVANPVVTFSPALTAPTAVTADQGGNVYIADSGAVKVAAVTGGSFALNATGISGVAIDGAGNLYTAQASVAGITKVLRSAASYNFGSSQTATFVGVLSNAGVTPGTGFGQSDTNGDFSVAAPAMPLAPSAAVCNLLATSIPAGTACNGSFTFTPSANGSGVITNTLTLATAGVTNTIGSLALTGTKTGANATTSTTVTGNTSGLVYAPGTETTFTVTVSETPAAAPTGSVSVYFDGSITPVSYPLTALNGSSSTATVTISGASAGSHSISATFASSAGITGSSSALTSYSIAQAPTSVTWNPSATTLQYSAAIGTGILDATANVPGAFVYTATSGSASTTIHSASYLPIGSYNLSVAFIPTDSVDYAAPSTTPTATLSVTQASTTAAIGATQTLVASDGTGNYTTVQAAVNALPSGGSIYIKPGTYNGFVTVVQPNISLRGLGGDPTKVVLTHAAGAFGSSYPYTGEFTAANSNGAQLNAGSSLFTGDEGSATIVVARGINTAIGSTQLIPNGFYAENLSFINSYNTDTTTTTTYESTANGTCVAGQPTAMTYTALYNAGTQCASQALAIWMTSDLAVINNVYFASLQDTVYTASPGSQVPSRQYWFRGKIAGDVDYIFGDAAAVFDSTTIYSAFHGNSATGTVTIHAQNQSQPTPAYLSGYILNNAVLTSQAPGMTNLYFGRPYGTYSTWVMLNSYVDQVNPGGYTTGLGPSLTNTTFLEYNDIPYTDPATNGVDINGVAYVGTGGNSGSGVTGARENVSTNPGTPEAGNNPPVTMTMAQAQAFFPTNFLGRTVSSSTTTNWNPTAALAANVNSFVPSGSATTITAGQSITLLMRPQTPGLGVIPAASYSAASPTPAVFTVPTGTYSLSDTTGGNTTVIASGNLDAAGEAYYVSAASAALAPGVHSLKWTYSGDSNFTGSTSSAYTLTVNAPAVATSTVVSANANPATYGQASTVTATVLAAGNPVTSGTVSLTVDGAAFGSAQALNASGQAVFSLGTLSVATHTIVANYSGATGTSASYNASSGNLSLVVQQATLTILGTCTSRAFYTANSCSVSVTGYATGDSASTVFSMAPVATTSAVKSSSAGSYPTSAAYTLTTAGSTNYTVVNTPGSFTITGGGNAAQSILFAPLPNLPSGTWQLSARSTSGLPVTYTVTGAGASINGKTLVLSGATGNVIQVTATQTDPSGDYATASATRSFTAQ